MHCILFNFKIVLSILPILSLLFKHTLETESLEHISTTVVELVLEFNPMQSDTMQAALQAVH